MKNKITKRFITTFFMLFMALSFIPATIFAATEIGDVEIESVTFNYNPGDTPKATAIPMDSWYGLYNIEYEYWEEMETNEKGESVPVKYWYSDKNKNDAVSADKRITAFEEGKTYMYSISLKAEDENTFATGKKVKVNGTYVDNKNVTNSGTKLFVAAIKTIKPKIITYQHISEVEINNATISFKAGDKPVFSGTTPKNVPYIYQSEYWSTDGGKKYYYAADFWNINNPDDLFTKFESGKSYTYGVYFKAAEGYCFTTDTKLKINGKYYKYHELDWESQPDVNKFSTMWITTDLTMTPTSTSSKQSEPVKEIKSTGETKATIEFADGISGNYELDVTPVEIPENLANKNVKYIVDINLLEDGQVVKISDTKMRIKIALPEDLKGFDKYEIVYISDDEIQETIPATIEDGYIVFETSHLSQYGIVATNVEEEETERSSASLKTGDNNNAILSASLFAVIALAVLGITIYNKNKKSIA